MASETIYARNSVSKLSEIKHRSQRGHIFLNPGHKVRNLYKDTWKLRNIASLFRATAKTDHADLLEATTPIRHHERSTTVPVQESLPDTPPAQIMFSVISSPA